MSEFSASYHLITSDQQEAANLLKEAGLHGYVFPETNGIVSFVVQQDELSEFTCCKQLLRYSTQPLLFYVNAEDHGWSYELYDHTHCIANYASHFNGDALMEGFDFDHPELFVPRDDVSHYIYSGQFHLSNIEALLKGCSAFDKKMAVIETSQAIVAAQNEGADGSTLQIKEEALPAAEFTEAFGLFFSEWISYHYVEMSLKEMSLFDYGRFGKFSLLAV